MILKIARLIKSVMDKKRNQYDEVKPADTADASFIEARLSTVPGCYARLILLQNFIIYFYKTKKNSILFLLWYSNVFFLFLLYYNTINFNHNWPRTFIMFEHL